MSNILHAIYKATATLLAPTANAPAPLESDAQGALWTSQATLIAGEDLTNNRLLNMPKYSYLAAVVADAQVKAGSGVLHTITMSSDAAATAGTLILYDSLTEAGTIILTINFVAAFLYLSLGGYCGIHHNGDQPGEGLDRFRRDSWGRHSL